MQQDQLLGSPCTWTEIDSQVNATATATHPANVGWTHYIGGISISCSGQPTSSVQVLIKAGAVVLDQWEIPSAAFGPIIPPFFRPYRGAQGGTVSVTIGAMGAGVRGTVSIRGFSGAP